MATPQLIKYFKTFTSNNMGLIDLLTGTVDIKEYNTVNFRIEVTPWVPKSPYQAPPPDLRVSVGMGSYGAPSVGQEIDSFPLSLSPYQPPDEKIRTYSVAGPDLVIWIHNAWPNVHIDINAWVFLH
jgi:hypothetical protein